MQSRTQLTHKKIRLREDIQQKLNVIMYQQRTSFSKATTILLILIVINLISCNDQSPSNTQEKKHREWTKVDKDAMTKACIEKAVNSYREDSAGTRKLCECATEKITSQYTYDQAQELYEKSQQEQEQALTPIINDCRNETSSK